ncbi:hypothetical protein Bca101_025450 [Brassica carinata]
MAKKNKPKKPSTKPGPTGSGSPSSSNQTTPASLPAVNSTSPPKQANPVDSSASSGLKLQLEPPILTPVTIEASESQSPKSKPSATAQTLIRSSVPETPMGSVLPSSLENKEFPQTQPPLLSKPQNVQDPAEKWRGFVSNPSTKMKPEQTPFILESGEACVKIPNSVIEKNKKSWDSFILGQFYEDPPPRGAVHAIVNGIWSRQKRDISVSKMDGHAFLFRVPCPNARRKILSQSLWQVDGQTMFVAKWSPGPLQEKPELSMVPVWLDFTGVPLQFFNRDALKEIAGLVGHPICLHPATENLTNIEVARVYTVIDPRKPLPEGVNAQFESGEITRITVSSPWLPSLCSFCKKVGHTISRCKAAPKTCTICNSVKHTTDLCPRNRPKQREGKAPVKSLLPTVSKTGAKSKPELIYKRKETRPPSPTNSGPSSPKNSGHASATDPRALPPKDSQTLSQETILPLTSVMVPPLSPAIAQKTFAEVSVSTPKIAAHDAASSQFALPAITTSSSKAPSKVTSSSAIVFDYDVSNGGLHVDLSPHFISSSAAPSEDESFSSRDDSSASDSLTGGEENLEVEDDQFIQVMTKRLRRQAKARGRGPLSL